MFNLRKILRLAGLILVLVSQGAVAQGNATTEKRVALVIGNANYGQDGGQLNNPVNDAEDIASSLRKAGFDVLLLLNSNRREMRAAIRQFGEKLKDADASMFYYSGHGIQIDGRNYLIPIGYDIATAHEVEDEAINLAYVFGYVAEGRGRVNVIVLDACRNNVFATKRVKGFSRGLATAEGPSGSLVAFATQPGNTASDGNSIERNSPYTKALLKDMVQPGLTVEEVFKLVRADVLKDTRKEQEPWEHTSLTPPNFYFFAPVTIVVNPPAIEVTQPTSVSPPQVEELKLTAKELFALAQQYESGNGKVKDEAEAVKLYRKAAEAGSVDAMHNLGHMLDAGRGGSKDESAAVTLYRKAAELGDAHVMTHVGWMLRDGRGVPKDLLEAAKWFRKAAGLEDKFGMHHLALLYTGESGFTRDDAQAMTWFSKAADLGYAPSMNYLGIGYARGLGVAKNLAEGLKWSRKAADLGDPDGMHSFGVMFADGSGVPKDDTEAVKWFRKAADLGNAGSMTWLGVMYADGRGVAKDDAEAVKWFRKAAELGNSWGMHNLGVSFRDGRGVVKNSVEAEWWFRKAAEKGNTSSMIEIGSMYEKGNGVKVDLVKANKWYKLAAEKGDENGQKALLRLEQSQR